MGTPVVNVERQSPSWERGQRLATRGMSWTLLDHQRGANCVALYLDPDGEPHRPRTLLSPFDRFISLPIRDAVRVVGVPEWIQYVERLSALRRPAGGLEAVASTGIRLLPYQLEPALAVLRHGATRVLIADAVGLGKTIQAGILISELLSQQPALRALVLVPAGLREQWAHELRRLFSLPTIPSDSTWLRSVASDRPSDVNPWCLPGVYLASQDFVKRPEVLRPLEDVTWDLLVVDEAHASSSRTDRRAAAHAIASRATRVLLLTATPHAGDPAEFAALCALGRIDPAEPPILLFVRSRRDAGGTSTRRSRLLAVRPTDAEVRMHELLERYTAAVWHESATRGDDLARLAAIVLRKRALSSAASLALSVRRRMALLAGRTEPAHDQLRLPIGDEDPLDDDLERVAVLGAPGLAHASREQRWLAAIAEAAQRASQNESKARFVRRFLNRIHEPAIVFTEYRDTLRRLAAGVAKDRPVLLLHGGMSPAERSRVHQLFNEGAAVLLSTDAAAEGLNLHAQCRLVVHYELPWSASRLEQRAGRVDRLGQRRRAHELGLVAATTAERIVIGPLMRRAWHAEAMGHGPSALAASLTESRVAEIVIGGAVHPPAEATTPVDGHTAATATLQLREEAEEEVGRLSARRAHLRARTVPEPARITRPMVSFIVRRRPGSDPELILIYLIALMSPAGLRVHTEVLALSLAFVKGDPARVVRRRLRRLVQPFLSPAHPVVFRAIARAVGDALEKASPVHGRVEESIRNRRMLMERMGAAAARRLVQPGLFERRAPHGGGRPAADSASLHSSQPLRSTSGRVLGVDVILAAALRVSRR